MGYINPLSESLCSLIVIMEKYRNKTGIKVKWVGYRKNSAPLAVNWFRVVQTNNWSCIMLGGL